MFSFFRFRAEDFEFIFEWLPLPNISKNFHIAFLNQTTFFPQNVIT